MIEAIDEFSTKMWREILNQYQLCPHLFKGRTLNVVSRGNSPFMNSDINKKINFDKDGIPLGSNGGISKVLSKYFGSHLNLTITTAGYIFDSKRNKWAGIFDDVSTFYGHCRILFYSNEHELACLICP